MNLPLTSDPWIGQSVGESQRYRIQSYLGGGSMGDVFVALDTRLGQQVALKILKSNWVSTDELRRRFEYEVTLCAALKGDHVVQVSDFGVTPEGYPFYVMDYLKGQTLGQLLRQEHRLPVERTVNIVKQVCKGLEAAHAGVVLQQGGERIKIVHRDLKPDNIFLTETALGELVKILDFGIAKIHHEQRENTHLTNMFIGTFHYASPEQVEVKHNLDGRSDIYSLGIILYEMLSGTDPFGFGAEVQDISQMTWAIAHVSKPIVPLHQQPGCEHLSPELEAVVMRCLAKRPDDRFASVNEFSQALQVAAHQQGTWQLSAAAMAPVPSMGRSSLSASASAPLENGYSENGYGVAHVQTRSGTSTLEPEPLTAEAPSSSRRLSPLVLAMAGFAIAIAATPGVYWLVSRDMTPREISTVSSPSPSAAIAPEQQVLEQATALAAAGKLAEAIDLVVNQIPETSPLYAQARTQLDVWSKQILTQAETAFQSGDSADSLNLVLTQLQVIPPSSSVYTEAQAKKEQWQRDWSTAEQLFNQAKEADAAGEWQTVLNTLSQIPAIPYWQEQAKPLATNARQRLAERDSVPVRSPSAPSSPEPVRPPAPRPSSSPPQSRTTPAPRPSPAPTESRTAPEPPPQPDNTPVQPEDNTPVQPETDIF